MRPFNKANITDPIMPETFVDNISVYFLTHDAIALYYAAFIGVVIGFEREMRGKSTSIRTFSLISMGSCLFTILSVKASGGSAADPYDLTRIAAQIVTGVGFIGGGVIFRTQNKVEGITSAALIWVAAALGMACGFGQYHLVLASFAAGVAVHIFTRILYETIFRHKKKKPIAVEEQPQQ